MKFKRLILILIIMSIFFSASCKKKVTEDPVGQDISQNQNVEIAPSDTYTIGEIADNVYVNNYFGMSIDIPDTLYVLPVNEMNEMNQQNLEAVVDVVVSGENTTDKTEEEIAAMMEEARIKYADYTSYCLILHGIEPTPEDSGNIQFIMQTYNTASDVPGSAKTPDEFLEIVKDNMRIKYGEGEFTDIYSETIGENQFQVQEAINTIGDITITEKVFVTKIKDYLVTFIVVNNSLATQDELDALDLLMDSVTIL